MPAAFFAAVSNNLKVAAYNPVVTLKGGLCSVLYNKETSALGFCLVLLGRFPTASCPEGCFCTHPTIIIMVMHYKV